MKKALLFFLLSITFSGFGQQLSLKKGVIIDDIKVKDSVQETFALYLPSNFEMSRPWPVVFVYDTKGRGRQVLSMFKTAAEEQGYILAASNQINDSLPLSKNVIISRNMFKALFAMVPINKNGVFTAGFADSGRLASLMPTFLRQIKGVISCGAPVANIEVLSSKNPFHFVGLVGNENFNYTEMLSSRVALNRLNFPNNLLVFDGGAQWPDADKISNAMSLLTLGSMARNELPKDSNFIVNAYKKHLGDISKLVKENRQLAANTLLSEVTSIYQKLLNVDSLKQSAKTLRKTKIYRTQNRAKNIVLFRESLIKEDYVYDLEEDVSTYNYNNLGWWQYQIEQLNKYEQSANRYEKHMGRRLNGFVNALIADNIDMVNAESVVDEEALNFLWMLKTIVEPKSYDAYLKVISLNAKVEDYGTALFYLEELLKNGYTNREELYSLEHTAIFRLSPEFNKIVAQYLKESRYEVIEE